MEKNKEKRMKSDLEKIRGKLGIKNNGVNKMKKMSKF